MVDPIRTLAPKNYTDDSVFGRVCDNIFFNTWQFACHQSQIPSTGDYHAFSIAGQDLFVIRNTSNEIRCFFNVCQHRGHNLVEGQGHANLLVCPYHSWSYDTSGRLRAAPGTKKVPGFDASKICLNAVSVDTLCGFVFVNLNPESPSLSQCFPGVESRIRAHCPEIDKRVFAHEFNVTEECNWLVAVENYNECYHCKGVHATFSSGVVDPDSYNISVLDDAYCLHHKAKAQEGNDAWYDTSGSDYASFFLWPAFSLQIYPASVVNTYHWQPLSTVKTQIHRQFFSETGAIDSDLRNVIDLDRDTTFAEDLDLVKRVQRGMSSRGYKGGPLVLNPDEGVASEHSVAALHRWFQAALAEDETCTQKL